MPNSQAQSKVMSSNTLQESEAPSVSPKSERDVVRDFEVTAFSVSATRMIICVPSQLRKVILSCRWALPFLALGCYLYAKPKSHGFIGHLG